jgi:hypothetical protein
VRLFLDLDGVLVDFDAHYEQLIGALPGTWRGTTEDHAEKNAGIDWVRVRESGFYASMPKMKDADELWEFCTSRTRPTIITGCPATGRAEAERDKRACVARHFGRSVPVITCFSREKSQYAHPGDILVDDWEKYRDLWVERGGLWVTHTSAATTIERLRELGL